MKKYFRRTSRRLTTHDYTDDGYYFVTICTKYRYPFFGDIRNSRMILHPCGWIAHRCINQIKCHVKHVRIDSWIIMPDHIHMIVGIRRGTACRAPTEYRTNTKRRFSNPIPKSLGTIIGNYKSAVSKIIHRMIKIHDDIWQRNYHEHVIRTDEELSHYREYIRDNPWQWLHDHS